MIENDLKNFGLKANKKKIHSAEKEMKLKKNNI